MLHSHFQCECQNHREKLRIEPFIYTIFSYHVFPHTLQVKVGQCFEIVDIFLLRDYDLLVIHVRLPTSFDALKNPLLKATADVHSTTDPTQLPIEAYSFATAI
jgi:hypothetical protein